MQRIDTRQQHWHIFFNPAAGGGKAGRQWPHLYPQLQALLPVHTLHISQARNHLATLVENAICEQGARYLLTIGGDGALHETINGIFRQQQVDPHTIVVALLPLGTGNDWIKTHRLPTQFEAWQTVFLAGHLQQQDIGKVDYQVEQELRSTYFVNAAGLAFDAYVVRYANSVGWRWMSNRFFYLWAILRCLFMYRLPQARIRWADQVREQYCYTISCGIGSYSGGGMQITPHADPADGCLAITLAGRLSPLAVLLNTYRFYNGTIGDHPRVTLFHTTELYVDSCTDQAIGVEADGEFLGFTPVHIKILPRALTFIAAGE